MSFGREIGKYFMGSHPKTTQLSPYTPQVQQLLQQNLTRGLGGMSQGQFDFAPIEQQARKNFSEKTIPSIAERFTSMGDGAQRSSEFLGTLGQAGAGLESDLAVQKQNYGLQQQQLLQNLLGMGQMQNIYQPSQRGFFEQLASMSMGGQGGQQSQHGLGQLMSLLMFL